MPSEKLMRSITRHSISEDFVVDTNFPVPAIPQGGARVKVFYAGACYTDGQVVNSGQKRPRMQGIHDTSLFPGYEMSGVVDEICSTATDCLAKVGDRVIVHPSDDEDFANVGYAEYVVVKDAANLIPIPDCLALDVAAIMPCGALAAYAAVQRAKPYVEYKLQTTKDVVNVLIVGAGGLGLWTLRLAEYYITTASSSRVRLVVADTNVERLMLAKDHGCYDVIHCDESVHEEYIKMRIKSVCKGGVDAVIDFVSSARTIGRATKVLKEGGVIIVGGNSKYEVPICLHTLAVRGQSIIGVRRGNRSQLRELVQLVAGGQIKPPVYSVYPVEEANKVFMRLSHSEIAGRAVLRVCSLAEADGDSVFFSPSMNQLMMAAPSGVYSSTDRFNGESPPFSPEPMSTSPDSASVRGATGNAPPPFFLPNTY